MRGRGGETGRREREGEERERGGERGGGERRMNRPSDQRIIDAK